MPAYLHHIIIPTPDASGSASYLADILELDPPRDDGPFIFVQLSDEVVVNFATPPVDIPMLHFAFLIDQDHFDRLVARFTSQDTTWWADPGRQRPGEFGVVDNVQDSCRMYFLGPEGHYYEVITDRYVL